MNTKKSFSIIDLMATGTFKIFITIATITVIAALFIAKFNLEVSSEPLPIIKTLNDKINGKTLREITKDATIINTGIYLENFPKFNVSTETFVADCIVWFEFPKDKVPLNLIDKFSIEDGNIKKQSTPKISTHKNITTVRYHIRVDLKTPIYYNSFPFDDHRITIQINNRLMDAHKMRLSTEQDFFVISKNFHLPDWKIVEKNKTSVTDTFSGFIYAPLKTKTQSSALLYPTAGFSFIINNTGWFGITIIFVPLFLLFFLALIGLLLSFDSYFRLSGTAGIVTTIILTYRFNISGIAPKVGYLTQADKIHIFIALITSLILVYQVIVHRILAVKIPKHKEEAKKKMRRQIIVYDSLMFSFIQFFVVGALSLLLFIS